MHWHMFRNLCANQRAGVCVDSIHVHKPSSVVCFSLLTSNNCMQVPHNKVQQSLSECEESIYVSIPDMEGVADANSSNSALPTKNCLKIYLMSREL